VVVATGPDAEPVMPSWPGMAGYRGRLIHSGQFRNTGEMAGRDVLVVGPGNSGVDLLNHLVRSDVAGLWLSARSGMNITPLRLAGIPLHPVSLAGRPLPVRVQDVNVRIIQRLAFGDLRRDGYPRSELGAFSRLAAQGVTVAVDDGLVRALKAGRVTVKPAVDRFEGRTVRFADGSACTPDIVICATGYRPALEPLVGPFRRQGGRGLRACGGVVSCGRAARWPLAWWLPGCLAGSRPGCCGRSPRCGRTLLAAARSWRS
jgi:hypothetical protein